MSAFSKIDLTDLAPPDVIKELSFDDILAEAKAEFIEEFPQYAAAIEFESDPICALMQSWAYRENKHRAYVNAAVKSGLLAFAPTASLDHIAALIPLSRNPGESNDDFRKRIQLAPEGFSVAGPASAYVFHTTSFSADILDVHIDEPTPGKVDVYVYQAEPITATRLNDISAALERVRPLNDDVRVLAYAASDFDIAAEITLAPGVDPADALPASEAAGRAYVASRQAFGKRVYKNAILTALQIDGIDNVNLISPADDILPAANGVAVIGSFEVSEAANV